METQNNNGIWTLRIAVAIIIIFSIIAFFNGCFDKKTETVPVKVPEVKGTFAPVKPIHDTIFLTKNVKSKPLTSNDGFLQSEIDRILKEYNKLDEAFANANDSLQQIIYSQAIKPKLFEHTFNNDTITATVKGIVANGEVDRLKLDYTIKPYTTLVKVPQTKFRLLGGIETGMSKSFDKFNVKANLGFQNAKGNILNIGADTDQRFYIGYSASIFTIKR